MLLLLPVVFETRVDVILHHFRPVQPIDPAKWIQRYQNGPDICVKSIILKSDAKGVHDAGIVQDISPNEVIWNVCK